jgi:DNA end-binding protein Ku
MAPRAQPAKSPKKSKKSSGQKEMLMPIEGKKLKEAAAKKTKSQRKSAQEHEFQIPRASK